MMSDNTDDLTWLEDGHKLTFRLERDSVFIFQVHCPYDGMISLCNKGRDTCVIDTFVSAYGFEINVGSVNIDGDIEIAWAPVLGGCDIDDQLSQLWFVPVEDPEFKAYKLLNEIS